MRVYVLDAGVGNRVNLLSVTSRLSAVPGVIPAGCYPHATHVAGIVSGAGAGCPGQRPEWSGRSAKWGRVYVGNGTDNSISVVDVPSLAVVATIPVGKFPFGIAVTPAGDSVYVTNNGDSTISVLSTSENKVASTIHGLGGVTSFGKFIGPAAPPGNVAVEYFNSGFGHYFITAIPDEIAKLDAGICSGWMRTGGQFHIQSSPGTGASPLCRFFTVAVAPKSLHFYAPRGLGGERTFANVDWLFEGDVFFASLPDANGICASPSLPVYRLYNNGQGGAPNHRFTTNAAIRAQMMRLGYIPEGLALGVAWCAPQ